MAAHQYNTREVWSCHRWRKWYFQVEVVVGSSSITTLGFCSIILLTIQRIFSPPLSTFVFLKISSPLKSILPKTTEKIFIYCFFYWVEQTGAASPDGYHCCRPVFTVIIRQVGGRNRSAPIRRCRCSFRFTLIISKKRRGLLGHGWRKRFYPFLNIEFLLYWKWFFNGFGGLFTSQNFITHFTVPLKYKCQGYLRLLGVISSNCNFSSAFLRLVACLLFTGIALNVQ